MGHLAWVRWGPRSAGVGLAGCRLLCAGKYVALLVEHERPSAPGLWGRYVSGDPVHDLASARGNEWLATCVPVQQGIK